MVLTNYSRDKCLHWFIWYLILIICIQLYGVKYSYPIQIIFIQIYLTLAGTTNLVPNGSWSNGNESTPYASDLWNEASPPDAVLHHTQNTPFRERTWLSADDAVNAFSALLTGWLKMVEKQRQICSLSSTLPYPSLDPNPRSIVLLD